VRVGGNERKFKPPRRIGQTENDLKKDYAAMETNLRPIKAEITQQHSPSFRSSNSTFYTDADEGAGAGGGRGGDRDVEMEGADTDTDTEADGDQQLPSASRSEPALVPSTTGYFQASERPPVRKGVQAKFYIQNVCLLLFFFSFTSLFRFKGSRKAKTDIGLIVVLPLLLFCDLGFASPRFLPCLSMIIALPLDGDVLG
jgi:hypothetical protein